MTASPHPITPSLAQDIKALAAEMGFDLCGFTPLKPLSEHEGHLTSWVNAGRAAGMEYMKRSPANRADPRTLFPSAKTAVMIGVSYFQGPLPPKPGPGFGRVARYAWGRDYHEIIGERLKNFGEKMKAFVSPIEVDGWAVDAKPVMERALAEDAGLGFFGKNTLIIAPRFIPGGSFHVGSFLFLAELMVENELSSELEPLRVPDGCGGCRSCLDVCPTEAFAGPKELDAGLCISYLTIENKGAIPVSLREKIGDWVFGCDACQDVCPFNARAAETRWPEFGAGEGAGAWLNLKEILSLKTTKEFKEKFKESPFLRSKRKGLLRNALVAAGNSRDPLLKIPAENALADDEPMVRAHALWAIEKLSGLAEAKKAAATISPQGNDPILLNEISRINQEAAI